MEELQKYREEARLRYQRKQEEEREFEKEMEREREKQREEEAKKERDHSSIYEMLADWDRVVEMLNQDMILSLHLLYTILTEERMDLVRKYDRMDEVQERVVRLVNRLNDLNEKVEKNTNLDEVREISVMMQQIIAQSGVDITIQEMNTDGDADFCRELQNEEEKMSLPFPSFPYEEYEEKKEMLLPSSSSSSSSKAFVSLSTTKGMRLQTLRALARSHEIDFDEKEGRRELAMRLASHGLVRIEE